jgi:hypothetical protein
MEAQAEEKFDKFCWIEVKKNAVAANPIDLSEDSVLCEVKKMRAAGKDFPAIWKKSGAEKIVVL